MNGGTFGDGWQPHLRRQSTLYDPQVGPVDGRRTENLNAERGWRRANQPHNKEQDV